MKLIGFYALTHFGLINFVMLFYRFEHWAIYLNLPVFLVLLFAEIFGRRLSKFASSTFGSTPIHSAMVIWALLSNYALMAVGVSTSHGGNAVDDEFGALFAVMLAATAGIGLYASFMDYLFPAEND